MKHLIPSRLNKSLRPSSFDEFDSFFNNFFSPTVYNEVAQYEPKCDIEETDKEFLVSLDIPGMNKKDIEVEVKDHQLRISGERKRENKESKEGYTRYERSYGTFQRVFSLPTNVDSENVVASYKDGELNITIPKAVKAKSQSVEIL